VNLATQDFKIVKEDLSSSLGGGKTDLLDRYFTVNPSVGRRPGGIFLDERLHLSTVKY
jgi:hypothetical protein